MLFPPISNYYEPDRTRGFIITDAIRISHICHNTVYGRTGGFTLPSPQFILRLGLILGVRIEGFSESSIGRTDYPDGWPLSSKRKGHYTGFSPAPRIAGQSCAIFGQDPSDVPRVRIPPRIRPSRSYSNSDG